MKKSVLKTLTAAILSVCMVGTIMPTITSAATKTEDKVKEKKPMSVAYFYEGNGKLEEKDVTKVTHLIYSFGGIYNHEETGNGILPTKVPDPSYTSDKDLLGTLYLSDKVKSDLSNLDKIRAKNPNLKITLAIGGYAGRGYSDASLTKESRAKLINSIMDAVNKYKLDGIDIDWETPVNGGWGTIDKRDEDKYNLTFLLEELKAELGKDRLLTMAAPVSREFVNSTWCEFSKIAQILDYMNVMIYDLAFAGPEYNSALHVTSKDPYTASWGMNGEGLAQSYITNGCPKEKLVFGIPFYGRVPSVNGIPKLISEQKLRELGFERAGEYNPSPAFTDIKNIVGKNGVEERWDDEAKVPYLVLVDPTTKKETFIMQYENEKSVNEKAKFAKEQGFAGTMVWELNQDDTTDFKLMTAINNGLGLTETDKPQPVEGPLNVAYFYEGNGKLEEKDVSKLTHLIYSFGGIYNHEVTGNGILPSGYPDPSYTSDKDLLGTLYLSDKVKSDLSNLDKIRAKNPNLKITLAIGGYAARGYSDACLTKESRAKLISSIMDAVNKYKLDGIDIDWETPVGGGFGTIDKRDEDKYNLTYFIDEMKAELGQARLLTMATPVSGQFWRDGLWCEFEKIAQKLDFMNVMIYDLAFAGPIYNSALYPSSKDTVGTNWTMNGKDITDGYVSKGCPKEKLVFGIPFYGRVPSVNNKPMNFSEEELKAMGFEKYGFYNPTPSYLEIKQLIGKNGIETRWDDEAKVPYLVKVDPTTKKETFIMQYEDEKSVEEKAKYAKEKGFAGTMVWELNQDDSESTLITSINRGLGKEEEKPIVKTPDLNKDGKVDALDIAVLASKYNLSKGEAGFDEMCDINSDKVIELSDLIKIGVEMKVEDDNNNNNNDTKYEEFDYNKDYPQGSIVRHEGKLYKARWYAWHEIPGASEWNAWELFDENENAA